MNYGTTDYLPAEGGHRYTGDLKTLPAQLCTVCDKPYWDATHALTEAHRDLRDNETPRFCVEASDNKGKTYAANGLRWADQADAERWAGGLALRWLGCTNIRVRRCRKGNPIGATVKQVL